MRLGDRESRNVEDRRGLSPRAAGGVGIVGAIAIVVIGLFLGVDPGALLQILAGNEAPTASYSPPPRSGMPTGDDDLRRFVSRVLAETEDTWHDLFQGLGRTYEEPRLVPFSGATQSACGFAQAAAGPFYCPGDRKVYLDLSFFRDLKTRYRASGEFAEAYVIAHEVGHHVQNLLGILDRLNALRARSDTVQAKALSVRLELQADCLAGVWANQANEARQILDAGDVAQGLAAASAVGDNRLQMRSRGYVVPESFTHGSAEQRMRWFKRGLDNGSLRQCDSFAAPRP